MKTATLHVTGDAYTALFYIPPFSLFDQESHNLHEGHVHAMPVGVEYIYRAIRAVCNPDALSDASLKNPRDDVLGRSPGQEPRFVVSPTRYARYEVRTVDKMEALSEAKPGEQLPVMRLARADSVTMNIANVTTKYQSPVGQTDLMPKDLDILVHWFGELTSRDRKNERGGPAPDCNFHVQIGLPTKLGVTGSDHNEPGQLANPKQARFVIVNIGEISESHRIRRSLSYEAIAVDLLRMLRGVKKDPSPVSENQDVRQRLGLIGTKADQNSFLLVRLNNSAVFVYECDAAGKNEAAWIVCHKKESAPLSQPELGQMVGHTGFVSAHLCGMLRVAEAPGSETKLSDRVLTAVQRSIIWQRAAYQRGYFHLLMRRENGKWLAIDGDPRQSLIGHDYMFVDIIDALAKDYPTADSVGDGELPSRLGRFDKGLKDVARVQVDIVRAVALRNPWFMARSVLLGVSKDDETIQGKLASEEIKKNLFVAAAQSWLVGDKSQQGVDVPVVEIGKAKLTDRREIEDFLAIHQALQVYAGAQEEKTPLNVAVFGAPGAGKSFAVKQVVNHLTKTQKGVFRTQELTFNISQFKTLNDLPDALHLVRNECLSGEIPIVFFDEFDASFQGQAFGWLKYFLAPMQDGEFYHAGQTFKMGRAVFVFAGGVNRSFEELNGRVRNPGFCEAKGPDFISRLKAHLNVQGINKPDDIEADEYRYILRRGKLLQDIVRRKLGYKDEVKDPPLLLHSVARALLLVDRFKHGARSLEAIIKMCSTRTGHAIGPSDLPSMDQLEMHVDATKLLALVDGEQKEHARNAG